MSEWLQLGVWVVLILVIVVLVRLLERVLMDVLPRLHESISAGNMGPIYDAALRNTAPIVADVLEVTGDELVNAAERTSTPFDDPFANWVRTELHRQSEKIDLLLRSLDAGTVAEFQAQPVLMQDDGEG